MILISKLLSEKDPQYNRKFKHCKSNMKKIAVHLICLISHARHCVGSRCPQQLLFHKAKTQTAMGRCCVIGIYYFGSNSFKVLLLRFKGNFENSVDPAQKAARNQGLHCLHKNECVFLKRKPMFYLRFREATSAFTFGKR